MPYFRPGASGLYLRVLQVGSGYWLDNTDGVFRLFNPTNPASFNLPLVENTPSSPSVYYFGDSREVWAGGVS